MKAPDKMTRNQRRKAAYYAMADGRSRNQEALDAPIVGRIEKRRDERTGREWDVLIHDTDTDKSSAPRVSHTCRVDERKARRKAVADANAAERATRSTADQIARLDSMGMTARRERARLAVRR